MRIGVYGVSRSGKSYLIDKILQRLPLKSINGSQRLSQISGVKVEEFKNLSDGEKRNCRCELINQLREEFPYDDLVIDGHYCFLPKEGKEYDVVFTENDLNFYDIFLYLDTPVDIILERFRNSDGFRKNLTITSEEIEDWKEYEIRELRKHCQSQDKDLIILGDDLDENIKWVELIVNRSLKSSSLAIAQDILDTYKYEIDKSDNILLLDCDKTLSINDSTIDFFKYLNFDTNLLKRTFNKDRYSLFQFNRIAQQYSMLNRNVYKAYCEKVAENDVVLAYETINCLKNEYEDFLPIGITAGLKDVWVNVSKQINFPQIVIGGSYLPDDRFVMSDEVKRLVAKKLREKGKYVVALGDSMVDMPMLMEADEGYLVAYEKINKSVQKELLCNKINIKQWKCSKCYYNTEYLMGVRSYG